VGVAAMSINSCRAEPILPRTNGGDASRHVGQRFC
jgi:hypothetical protein